MGRGGGGWGRVSIGTREPCSDRDQVARSDHLHLAAFNDIRPSRLLTILSNACPHRTRLKAKNPLATQPIPIRRTANPSQHNLSVLSLEPAFSLSSRSNSQSHSDSNPNNPLPMLSLLPSSYASTSSSADALVQTPGDRVAAYTHTLPRIASQTPDEMYTRDLKGKGKERGRSDDSPPVLPPLGFSPPIVILSPSGDLWPDIGVASSSNVVASPLYFPRRRAYRTDGDDPLETDGGIEVDITNYEGRFLSSASIPHSPLPRHLPESPRSLQRFVPPLDRQPYTPHHIPSHRHSFSNRSRPHLLSDSNAALSPGMNPGQGPPHVPASGTSTFPFSI